MVDGQGRPIYPDAPLVTHADIVVDAVVGEARYIEGTAGYPTNRLTTLRVVRTYKGSQRDTVDILVHGYGIGSEFVPGSEEPGLPAEGRTARFYLTEAISKTFGVALLGELGIVPEVLDTPQGTTTRNPAFDEDATALSHHGACANANYPTGFSGFNFNTDQGNRIPIYRPGTRLNYRVSPLLPSQFRDDVDWILAQWNAVPGSTSVTASNWTTDPLNPTPPVGDTRDGISFIAWEFHRDDWTDPDVPNDAPPLARAFNWTSDASTNPPTAGESDITFNSHYQWAENAGQDNPDGQADLYSFRLVGLHEVGHNQGLGHVRDHMQMMSGAYCHYTGTNASLIQLQFGDRAGRTNLHKPTNDGYWMLTRCGEVYALGGWGSFSPNASYYGGPNTSGLNCAATTANDIEVNPADPAGYWVNTSNGGVYSYGSATYHGSVTQGCGTCAVVDLAPTRTGNGYWQLEANGGVWGWGDAIWKGGGNQVPNFGTAAGMDGKADGSGYVLINTKGQTYTWGVPNVGGGIPLQSQPAKGVQLSTTGNGYWILGADGGIFAYGDAPFYGGAAPGTPGVQRLSRHPYTDAYQWMNSSGGIYQSTNLTHYGIGTGRSDWVATELTVRPGTQPPPPPPPPAPDFSVSASPSTLTITLGTSKTSTVTASANSTWSTATVSFSATAVPAGVSTSFSPSSVSLSLSTSKSSTLTITVPATYTGGSFTMTARGCSGSTCRTRNITVNVSLV